MVKILKKLAGLTLTSPKKTFRHPRNQKKLVPLCVVIFSKDGIYYILRHCCHLKTNIHAIRNAHLFVDIAGEKLLNIT